MDRKQILLVLGLLLCASSVFALEHEEYMLKLINGARSRPVHQNEQLSVIARNYARTMAQARQMGHYVGSSPQARISQSGYRWTNWGENVAVSNSATGAFRLWLNSAGHRQNMLGNFVDIGIGESNGYWVTVFASPAVRASERVAQVPADAKPAEPKVDTSAPIVVTPAEQPAAPTCGPSGCNTGCGPQGCDQVTANCGGSCGSGGCGTSCGRPRIFAGFVRPRFFGRCCRR